jgi:CheY-like chemotaxis protein
MNIKKPTLLVVDDDPVCLEAIKNYLNPEDYTVITAESGEEAWEILSSGQHNFSTIVTDRMMPKMDGIELSQKINAHPLFRKIPIIMVTIGAERSEVVNAIQGGVFDFLMKPVEQKLLLLVLKRALEKRHSPLF